MKLNWDRIGKQITPKGWKIVASRPDVDGWEFCWETGYGGDFAFSAIVITARDVKAVGRKNVAAHYRDQLAEHDRDMKAGGEMTRKQQKVMDEWHAKLVAEGRIPRADA